MAQIVHDGSQPGVPQTNSLVGRINQTVISGAISCVLEAGLPPCFWSFAGPCFCMLVNTDTSEGKESPWFWTHGEEFQWKRLPFGCKVVYKPSVTKMKLGNFEEPSCVGAVAGYDMLSG
jgi:hypothetical protein